MPFDARPVTSPALELLRAARARIDRPEKWCKFSSVRGSGARKSYCVMGALNEAHEGPLSHYMPVFTALLSLTEAKGLLSISEWNDASATKHADVMILFDEAEGILVEESLNSEGPAG